MKEIEHLQMENTDIEIRNKFKYSKFEFHKLLFRTFGVQSFGFVSNFGFRASNLVLLVKAIQEQQIEELKKEIRLTDTPITANFDGVRERTARLCQSAMRFAAGVNGKATAP